MLPAYIIHDILERERRRREKMSEDFIDAPDIEPPSPSTDEGEVTSERGVVIVDFTI